MTNVSKHWTAALVIGLVSAAALGDGMIVPIRPDLRVRGSWAVKYHHVSIRVRDQVAHVSVDQEFVNTGRGMIEVEYLFPVPPGAAIKGMTLMVNGKEFKAELMEADKARKIYEDIVRRKKDPALLEYAGFGLYRTKAFPLVPGKPARVVVNYDNVCRKDFDTVEVWYPLNTEKFSARPIESVRVKVDIRSKADITTIYSPTHDLSVKRDAKNPGHVTVVYEVTKAIPTTDFQVFYKAKNEAVGATFLTHQGDPAKDGYFMLLVSPNPRSAEKKVVPKDVVLVMDHSGSMSGDKLDQAKEAVAFVLKNLNKADRFNVVAYSDGVEPLLAGLAGASLKNIQQVLERLDAIDATGGTNIHEALQVAMKLVSDAAAGERPKYVIFLTDGLPTVGKTVEQTKEATIVADTAKANTAKARLFAFGVGYDVNVRLLDKLVAQNGGRSDYVKPKEPIERKIASLYAKIKNPVMTNLSIRVDKLRFKDMYPREIGDLFEGDQIILVGRYRADDLAKLPQRDGKRHTQLIVQGTYQGRKTTFEYPVSINPKGRDIRFVFVERLWAMRRIGWLLDQIQLHGKSKETLDELIRLSKHYGIITPYTSFLAIETDRLADTGHLRGRMAESARMLRKSTAGRAGQWHAMNRQELNMADRVAPASAPGLNGRGGGARVYGWKDAKGYEKGAKAEDASKVRQTGKGAVYRRKNIWVTPETAKLDLVKDADKIKVIERFTKEYFDLVRANATWQNQLLASQGAEEEMLISLRGQVYRIK